MIEKCESPTMSYMHFFLEDLYPADSVVCHRIREVTGVGPLLHSQRIDKVLQPTAQRADANRMDFL